MTHLFNSNLTYNHEKTNRLTHNGEGQGQLRWPKDQDPVLGCLLPERQNVQHPMP